MMQAMRESDGSDKSLGRDHDCCSCSDAALNTAAIFMSVFLLATSMPTTLLIRAEAFQRRRTREWARHGVPGARMVGSATLSIRYSPRNNSFNLIFNASSLESFPGCASQALSAAPEMEW